MTREIVSVPAGKVYFAEDYIQTYEDGLFHNMDALIVYVNDNIKQVTGSRYAEVIRWEQDKTNGDYTAIYRTCDGFDNGCTCTADSEANKAHDKLTKGMANDEADAIIDAAYDLGNQNRNPKDCESELWLNTIIEKTGIEVGVIIR